MKSVSDTLIVVFDSSLDDEAGLYVSRVVNGKIKVLKMEIGEQADILYHLLTDQTDISKRKDRYALWDRCYCKCHQGWHCAPKRAWKID